MKRKYTTNNTMEPIGFAPTFKVSVDQDSIDKGCRENSNHCMIARAVKKAHPELSRVAVDIQTIRATDANKGERYIWLTPPSAQRMIVDFDAGKNPTPAKCTLSGGQTIKISKRDRKRTRAAADKADKKYRAKKAKIKADKARGGLNHKPKIIGGHEPPRSIGARRQFGLRGLPMNAA